LLIVATESAVDQEKPVSSWVHRFLGLAPNCRNFEVKHACYAGTAAVQMAVSWLEAEANPQAKALVVSADHALIGLHGVQEPVLGAGAAAILLSREPAMLAYERGWNGIYSHESGGYIPSGAGSRGRRWRRKPDFLSSIPPRKRSRRMQLESAAKSISDRFFAANIYHVPFGGMAERAHCALPAHVSGSIGPTRARTSRANRWRRSLTTV